MACITPCSIQLVHFVKDQLPSNPSLFFIQFPAPHPPDVEYEPIAADLKTTVPPSNFSKRCGILAPYGAFLYRAEVLNITRSADKQHLYVKVKFVDFGNIERVDFFKCHSISKQYLYPPKASPCQLYNIRPEEWKGETLDLFRQYLNNSTPQIKARVSEFSDAFKITTTLIFTCVSTSICPLRTNKQTHKLTHSELGLFKISPDCILLIRKPLY